MRFIVFVDGTFKVTHVIVPGDYLVTGFYDSQIGEMRALVKRLNDSYSARDMTAVAIVTGQMIGAVHPHAITFPPSAYLAVGA